MFCDDINAIVVHVGHLKSQIGFVGDETPTYQTDSYIYRSSEYQTTFSLLDDLPGSANPTSDIIVPLLSSRKITNIPQFAEFLSAFASKINVELTDVALFMTSNIHESTVQERRGLLTHFFEEIGVPAMFFNDKNLNCIFANGRQSGMVVDSGSYFTEAVSVYQGHVLKKCIFISPQIN